MPDVIAIAHRGDPVGGRENTPAAFASAVALGADWVELDLRLTRDGVSSSCTTSRCSDSGGATSPSATSTWPRCSAWATPR